MTIVNFTPFQSLAGGALIGVATTIYLITTGRIAGISGILKSITHKSSNSEKIMKLVFIIGLVVGGFLYLNLFENTQSATTITNINPKLIVAAILVGIGTAFGNGCTSGHGICGMARRSKRSVVATIIFMIFGILTVYFIK